MSFVTPVGESTLAFVGSTSSSTLPIVGARGAVVSITMSLLNPSVPVEGGVPPGSGIARLAGLPAPSWIMPPLSVMAVPLATISYSRSASVSPAWIV